MADDVQLDDGAPAEPAAALLDVARTVTHAWLTRISVRAAGAARSVDADLIADIDEMAAETAGEVLERLEHLLRTDVDEQATNPLSVFRAAVARPTEVLRRHGVPEPGPDAFADARFPDDPYRLGPATWADIDAQLHEPGLMWGAWKAMTVLRRRRDEGLR